MVEKSNNWAACIVYYNDLSSLNNLLNDLGEQELKPQKVYICDNNSSIPPTINNINLDIEIYKMSENKGFGAAANQAVKLADKNGLNNYILFSQDVRIHQLDATKKLVNALNAGSFITFPTMVNRKNGKVFSNGGGINFLTGKIYLYTRINFRKKIWADGSCLAFTKEVFQKTNGFDEEYFMYFEDVDFCYRAKSSGVELKHVPVRSSQTPNGPSPYLRSKNSVKFAKKTKLKWFLAIVVKRNFLGALKSILTLDLKSAKDRISGIGSGLRQNVKK